MISKAFPSRFRQPLTSSASWKWSQVVFKKMFFSIKTCKDLCRLFRQISVNL